MKIWMSIDDGDDGACIHTRMPVWGLGILCWYCRAEDQEVDHVPLVVANRLHRALTGKPLPPWPLLSEIEIKAVGPYEAVDGWEPVGRVHATREFGVTEQVCVWYPEGEPLPHSWFDENAELPDGWEWE